MTDHNYFNFAGVASNTMNVWVSGTGTFPAPARDAETIIVPGRNGTLMLDNGRWNDIDIVYPCFIPRGFESSFAAFRAWLASHIGYYRLEDSYDTETYRMAAFYAGLQPQTGILNRSGQFDVSFHCKPQKWLKSGETAIAATRGMTLTNPTLFEARPLVVVGITSGGSGTLTIGTDTLTITSSPVTSLTIDCERQDVYAGGIAYNSCVTLTTGDFPTLKVGNNSITWTGNISSVRITPRWWTL